VKNQEYYEQFFEPYPDVITLDEFRTMLGGIGETTVRKILHGKHILSVLNLTLRLVIYSKGRCDLIKDCSTYDYTILASVRLS
jgi:hypothetical protein